MNVVKKIIVANCNETLDEFQDLLAKQYNAIILKKKGDLSYESLRAIKPDYIFFMHWSWLIPEDIYSNFNCIVFHMTNLPFGRGGSPLQNLIIRGYSETKISAIRVDAGIDTGDIYIKKDLSLKGTAAEIFVRAGEVMMRMIEEIIKNDPTPVKQHGEPTYFKRRKPEQSLISGDIDSIECLYDFIRMLDAKNYPKAFIENETFKFEFTQAQIENGTELAAHVRIVKK